MYRCAIIGCGAIGGDFDRSPRTGWSFTHAGAYRLSRQTGLVAAADSDAAARARFRRKWGVRALFADYEQMLEEVRPDIVSICLPTPLHLAAFRSACAFGVKAIYCEKPLSDDLREARKIAKLAEGRVVAVNYFRRWNRSLIRLQREFRRGRLGKPTSVVVRYTKGIFVNGSHYVDLARWFWGEPTAIRLLRRVERPDGDPGVDFLLRFREGFDVCFLHVPEAGYTFLDADILTDRGRIVIAQRAQTIERFRLVLEPHYRKFRILRRVSEGETAWRECLPQAVRELARCIATGRRPSCTTEDGLRAVEICHQAAWGR